MKIEIHKGLDQREAIAYLIKHKLELIDLKKSAVKQWVDSPTGIIQQKIIGKAIMTTDEDTEDSIKRTIIGNTYNWMDSHDDVHLDGVFSVSLQQKGDRMRHFHDHVQQLSARVGVPIKTYEQPMPWTSLGVNKAGNTMCLMMDSNIKRAMNPMIFDDYKDGNIDQHSVSMQYVKIDLAVNSPEDKEAYTLWNKYIDRLGNPERAMEKGYFWPVTEAKVSEISCVLEGSNSLTPMMNPSMMDSSSKIDPLQSSQPIKTIFDYLN